MTMRLGTWLGLAALAAPASVALAQAASEQAAPAQTAQEKLEAVVERYNKQRNDGFAKAKTNEERQALLVKLGKEYIPELRALAEEARGTDAAVEAQMWVFRIAVGTDKDAAKGALDILLDEHVASAKMEELPGELRYVSHSIGAPAVIDALRSIAEGSPHKSAQASALFTLAAVLHEESNGKPEMAAEARTLFERVSKEYGDLAYWNKTYKAAAEGFLYEIDHLQIGMVAPDFDAMDENGMPFKLTDYRGRVVVVDFWGFW